MLFELDEKIESCCEVSAECCSVNEVMILSCCDASAECCSANEALSLSCCDVLSTSTTKLQSIVDGLDNKIESCLRRISRMLL